jgi:predicted transcriptional regulator of viral defense system
MKNPTETSYNYLDKYLTGIRARGRYSFSLEELKSEFGLPYLTIKQNLYRLKSKNKIAQIRQGFYVIIPPEYSKQGTLPAYLFLDDLMKFLNKPYYLAMLSAAALYGAAHQQPMEYSVITKSPVPRSINSRKLKINFFSKRELPREGIVQRKTMAGYINVSSPELTALDLFAYTDKLGVNRVVSILQELSQEMKPVLLKKTAMSFPVTTVIQRLGYILEKVLTEEKLAESLLKVLNKRTSFPVPLSSQKEKKGETDIKWKVIKNLEIESEL